MHMPIRLPVHNMSGQGAPGKPADAGPAGAFAGILDAAASTKAGQPPGSPRILSGAGLPRPHAPLAQALAQALRQADPLVEGQQGRQDQSALPQAAVLTAAAQPPPTQLPLLPEQAQAKPLAESARQAADSAEPARAEDARALMVTLPPQAEPQASPAVVAAAIQQASEQATPAGATVSTPRRGGGPVAPVTDPVVSPQTAGGESLRGDLSLSSPHTGTQDGQALGTNPAATATREPETDGRLFASRSGEDRVNAFSLGNIRESGAEAFSPPSAPSAAQSTPTAQGSEAMINPVSGTASPASMFQPAAAAGPVQPSLPQAALPAPLASPQWQQELGQQMSTLVHQGDNSVSLRLNPAELGPLVVEVKVSEQQAQLQFLSAHAQVRGAVEQAIPQLREALAEQGISLGETSVGEQRGEREDNPARGHGGERGQASHSTDAGPAEQAGPVTAPITLPGGVNLYV